MSFLDIVVSKIKFNYQKMPKLLFVLHDICGIGGMQSINKKVASALTESGIKSDFFIFHKAVNKDLFKRIKLSIKNAFLFTRALKSNKTTCILNIAGYEVILFTIICIIKKIDFIYWEHGDPDELASNITVKLLRKFFYRKSKAIVVLHRNYIKKVNQEFSNVVCIPNIVPQMNVVSVNLERKINSVVWVGRLGVEKNPTVAFDAMSDAATRLPQINFYFIYPFGEESVFIVPPLRNMHIINGQNFNFENYFNENSLHLLTSKTEAMPGVLMESTSCLSRFISTDCSPWVHDLASLKHGLIVPVDIGYAELSNKIIDTIANTDFNVDSCEIKNLLAQCNKANIVKQWHSIVSN